MIVHRLPCQSKWKDTILDYLKERTTVHVKHEYMFITLLKYKFKSARC